MSSTPVSGPTPLNKLLTWSDPVATGKVFGAVITALLLAKINFVPHFFHLLYLGLLGSAAAEYAGRILTGEGFVSKYVGQPKSYAQTFRSSVLPAVANGFDCAEKQIHTVLFAQQIECTLKAAGSSYILYKVTLWFSFYTLVFALVILAFTVPVVYKNNKKQIDAVAAQYTKLAKEKSSEYTACAQKKLSPYVETLAQKTGPVGAFVKSKFPTRTAGSTVSSTHVAGSEPASGVSSGATQFPEVPSANALSITEVVEETEAKEVPKNDAAF